MQDSKSIEVRFRDVDALGHVNNAVYFSYFEQARIKFFGRITGSDWDWNAFGVLLARNEIDYLQPILLNDQVEVVTKTQRVGNKSFDLTYEVYAIKQGKPVLCAKGMSVLVCYDHKVGGTVAVPDFWKEKLLSE